MYLNADLDGKFSLSELEYQFDVILVEPPLEEYKLTNGVHLKKYMDWDKVRRNKEDKKFVIFFTSIFIDKRNRYRKHSCAKILYFLMVWIGRGS
jgi:hypothetical protein